MNGPLDRANGRIFYTTAAVLKQHCATKRTYKRCVFKGALRLLSSPFSPLARFVLNYPSWALLHSSINLAFLKFNIEDGHWTCQYMKKIKAPPAIILLVPRDLSSDSPQLLQLATTPSLSARRW
jgi:hypothetical protein